jgi:TolB-like protein
MYGNKETFLFKGDFSMRNLRKRTFLAALMALLAGAAAAQEKANLAVLPFTGGTGNEGETIAELFSYSRELRDEFGIIPRTSITGAIRTERQFQTGTGMTDPDTIAKIGQQLGAQYVVAGNIAKLGNQSLLIISILKIDDLR